MIEPTQVGEIAVRSIIDVDDQEWPADLMLPDSSPNLLRAAPEYASAASYNAETNGLRFRFGGFLFEAGARRILVDAGVGAGKRRPETAWNMLAGNAFLDSLAEHGTRPQDVDVVVTTHAHADHVGWLTVWSGDRWMPTFPRAEYVFLRAELDHWVAAYERDAEVNSGATADSVVPLLDAANVSAVADGYTIAPGVTLEAYPGHTPGNAVVWLESAGAWAAFCGDTLHHPIQLRYPSWSCRFCADAERSAASRRRLLDEVADRSAVLLPSHFREKPGRIIRDADAYRVSPVRGDEAASRSAVRR